MSPRRREKWTAFKSPEVAAVFEKYPADVRVRLMQLRQLVFDTAEATEGVGELEEALRWGEPSYLTTKSKSGTTIRIDSKAPDEYSVFVHCQTDLIERFKTLYPTELEYDGNRSITLHEREAVPEVALRHCISLALTYHLDKKKGRRKPRKTSRR